MTPATEPADADSTATDSTATDSTATDSTATDSTAGNSTGSGWQATRPGVAVVVAASGVAVALAAVTLWATALAAVGALVHVAGVMHERPRARGLGALALLGATIAGAYSGLSTVGVLAGVTAAVVAYDAGERTTTLHAQVPDAATARLELRRAAWTTTACVLAGALAVAVTRVPRTTTPAGAALALVGGVIVALALRDDPD